MMSRMKFDGRSEDPAGVAVAASPLWVDEDMIAVPQFKTTKNAEKASFAEKLILRGERRCAGRSQELTIRLWNCHYERSEESAVIGALE
jgi:hypothetical protein